MEWCPSGAGVLTARGVLAVKRVLAAKRCPSGPGVLAVKRCPAMPGCPGGEKVSWRLQGVLAGRGVLAAQGVLAAGGVWTLLLDQVVQREEKELATTILLLAPHFTVEGV